MGKDLLLKIKRQNQSRENCQRGNRSRGVSIPINCVATTMDVRKGEEKHKLEAIYNQQEDFQNSSRFGLDFSEYMYVHL